MKYIWKFFKIFVITVVVLMLCVVGYRLYEAQSPKAFRKIYWNAIGIDAYNEYVSENGNSKEFAEKWTNKKNYSDKGRFFANDVIYIESAKQLQVTVSYNYSTFEFLKEDRGYTEIAEGEPFLYAVVINKGERVYDSYCYTSESTQLHNFRKLIFDGVDIEDGETVMLYCYYKEDAEPDSEPYGTINLLYDYTKFSFVKIKKADRPSEAVTGMTAVSDWLPEIILSDETPATPVEAPVTAPANNTVISDEKTNDE